MFTLYATLYIGSQIHKLTDAWKPYLRYNLDIGGIRIPSTVSSMALRGVLDLPNEVLDLVVAELTPDELVNTALSCRAFYKFCKDSGDLERHLSRQKAYGVLNLGEYGMNPLELMAKLDEDWRVAYYVKAVHFKEPKTGPLFGREYTAVFHTS